MTSPFRQVRKEPFRYASIQGYPHYRVVFVVDGKVITVYQVRHTSRKPDPRFGTCSIKDEVVHVIEVNPHQPYRALPTLVRPGAVGSSPYLSFAFGASVPGGKEDVACATRSATSCRER